MEERRPRPGKPATSGARSPNRPLALGEKNQLEGILRSAGCGGSVEVTSHFKMRAAQRGFSTPDALNALRNGKIVTGPEFCAEFCNWKFSVSMEHDDGDLVIVATVCAGEKGQICSKNVMLVTGFIK